MTNKTISEDLVKEMVRNGVVLGHKKSKTHPKMRHLVAGNRNEIEVLNPSASWNSLESAVSFLKDKVSKGAVILFVATKPSSKAVVKSFAGEFKYPCVSTRWLGGTLTNFEMIKKRLSYFEKMMEKKEKGEFAKYTKKERSDFDKEIGKLSINFSGLLPMKKLPDVVFVVDAEAHKTAVQEANLLNIPIVAVLDTNDNPTVISNPIYANDHSSKSIEWIVNYLRDAVSPIVAK